MVCAMASEEAKKEKIVVIGDSTLVTGFRLAGVTEYYLATGRDAEAKLAELMETGAAGVIIVPEEIMVDMDWRLKKKIEAAAKPVVVPVPGRKGPVGEAESLREMVKRALGFDLMQKK
ncbi:V-type ATP synthase subunit F [Candidatus Burarchaeum australiense]|nr:V-type ATP synthase subunit F [Candidatus Burarchaeum australiense]